MGTAYAGSLMEWIDQHGGATRTSDELFVMAQQEGKPYTYEKIRSARNARRGVTMGPDGKPVRGEIWKQRAKAPKLSRKDAAKPGYFSGARAGAKAPPPLAVAAGVVDIPVPVRKDDRAPHGRTLDGKPRGKPGPKPKPKQATSAGKHAAPNTPLAKVRKAARDAVVAEVYQQKRTAALSAGNGLDPDAEAPPPKHTALRKLILEVGLDTAREIMAQFEHINEYMR